MKTVKKIAWIITSPVWAPAYIVVMCLQIKNSY